MMIALAVVFLTLPAREVDFYSNLESGGGESNDNLR
jgi:hypothetical protein